MYEWLQLRLKEHTGVRIAQRRAWWATLQWYFGYCAKKGLGEPFERENSHIFLRELHRSNPRTQGDSTQREAALNWFFSEVVATDSAGQRMRRALRREHMAASTEKAYMGCLRRFQAFVHPRDAMQVDAAAGLAVFKPSGSGNADLHLHAESGLQCLVFLFSACAAASGS
jgi:hypothetical protein